MQNIAKEARESGLIPPWPAPPKPPLARLLNEGCLVVCPECGSSMKLTWKLKRKCIHPECGGMGH